MHFLGGMNKKYENDEKKEVPLRLKVVLFTSYEFVFSLPVPLDCRILLGVNLK